ncbi:MAG: hypothetical protein HKP48_05205 [Winogradskyella sp.]|uniref:hypothetical protein n=1 Tax=Winogradskyella sp. TaxID=1883156 RepID=UPI0017ADDBC1|nr:hypothetical protein [Winogradskyella sp.]NNK22696.1 hypothetical protein [Winogradskyella sp.]
MKFNTLIYLKSIFFANKLPLNINRTQVGGTKNKIPEQLENEIESLGALINSYATDDGAHITGSPLSKNFDATMI